MSPVVSVVIIFISLVISIQGSVKKGTAAYPGNLLCDDFKVLNKMSWWYDWHQDMDFFYQKVGSVCDHSNGWNIPPHVPMLKKYNNHTQLHIQTWGPYVLGFNEPNHKDQADMTPQEAADAWPLLEQNSHGAQLVSPTTAGAAFWWYDAFFKLCHGCRFDFIAAHMYNCDANAVMSYLQKLYHRYNKKIWLTEFACPHSTDENQQLNLMKNLLPQLEAAPFVFRYSWFSARIMRVFGDGFVTPAASLLHQNRSELTMIGQFYNNFEPSHGHHPHVVG